MSINRSNEPKQKPFQIAFYSNLKIYTRNSNYSTVQYSTTTGYNRIGQMLNVTTEVASTKNRINKIIATAAATILG